MASDWEDDWENMDESLLQISIIKKERELRLLEERKLMEEADLALAEELFSSSQYKLNQQENIEINKKTIIKPVAKKNKPNKELMEMQKLKSEQDKMKKKEEKRKRDIFGESLADEYEDRYCHIEEKYYK